MTRAMHPYRSSSSSVDHESMASPEELILYGMLIAIGAIPVVIALAERATFGADATLGLLMVGAGAVGAIAYTRRVRAGGAQPADGDGVSLVSLPDGPGKQRPQGSSAIRDKRDTVPINCLKSRRLFPGQ